MPTLHPRASEGSMTVHRLSSSQAPILLQFPRQDTVHWQYDKIFPRL